MTLGNAWGNEMLNHALQTATRVSLHVSDPGPDGQVTTEVVGGSYARLEASWGYAASRTAALSTNLSFMDMPQCIVTHAAVWSKINGIEKMVACAAFDTPRAVGEGEVLNIMANNFAISL